MAIILPMTVGVVGLGLIGGSIGLALREPGRTVIGHDLSPESIKTATDRMCIDSSGTLAEVADADVVFVAVPPAHVVPTLSAISQSKRPDTVFTDCTSVKAGVVAWASESGERNFVVGHPMAGHQNSGASFASAWMFRGAKWILSPLQCTSKPAVQTVEALIKAMGATPVRMAPERHDRQVAILSHLPHALAGLLVQMRENLPEEDVSGGSWKDLTRVGGVDPGLWTQIFLANRVELSKVLSEAEFSLAGLRSAVEAGDELKVRDFFESARKAKKLHEK